LIGKIRISRTDRSLEFTLIGKLCSFLEGTVIDRNRCKTRPL
jgi:hypothetical protein